MPRSARHLRPLGTRRVAWSIGLVMIAGTALAQPDGSPSEPQPVPAASPVDQPIVRADLDEFEGRPVRRVTIRGVRKASDTEAALSAEREQLVRNNIRLREGTAYSRGVASADIERLNRLGQFERVESRVAPLEDGGVAVIVVVVARPIIQDVRCVGNKLLTDTEITKAAQNLVGTAIDPTRIDAFCRRIEEIYRNNGYYNAKVTPDQSGLESTGVLTFKIREGERTKVLDIRFEGNLAFTRAELIKNVKSTKKQTFVETIFESAPLDKDTVANDVGSLVAYYRDRGYLDVRVDRDITLSGDSREAIITFVIEEGRIYTLRDVRVEFADEGERAMSLEQIRAHVPVKSGGVYSAREVENGVQAVQNAYSQMGYVDCEVARREMRDTVAPVVDLVVIVREGRRFRTGEVVVGGNTTTRDRVIRRNITVQPDRWLDETALNESKRRIENTRLFAERSVRLTLQPEREDEPGFRDVLAEVDETNTGQFSVGVVAGSDGGVTALFGWREQNFDIQDPPDTFGELFTGQAFRGGGQVFNAQLLPGDRAQTFSLSLSEPSLFDSNIGGSVGGFFRRRVFDEYDELRYGASFSLSRAFGSRWKASLPLRVEAVDLNNIDPTAPTDYFEVDSTKILTSLGLKFSRTTFDVPFSPSRGNGLEFGIDQVGVLGGDFTYNVLSADYALYLPVSEDFLGRRTVFSVKTGASYIPQKFDTVPVFERFYRGGQNFRGFAFRGVSPRGVRNDNGQPSTDPVGGNFSFTANFELQQPLYEDIFSGVVFLDTGTVNRELSLANYRATAGFGFRLKFAALSQVPLAFDFGFPILKDETDRERVFTFAIDIPF